MSQGIQSRALIYTLVGLCYVLFAAVRVSAATETVAVLYPRIAYPEQAVFTLMREGIRASVRSAGASIVELELPESETPARLAERIKRSGATRLCVLGRRAYQLSAGLEKHYPLWIAGVNLPAGRSSRGPGTSLFPRPSRVFETLRAVRPEVQRVIVVIDRRRFDWMVDDAAAVAKAVGLELAVYEAGDLKEAANHLWNIVRYGNPRFDALWILESDQFVTPDIFPRLVEESWVRRFPIISNVLEHANHGALFATYLNPGELGERVGREVMKAKRADNEIHYLDDVAQALNGRVAAHLKVDMSPAVVRRFDRILGEP